MEKNDLVLIQRRKSYDIVQVGYKCKNALLYTP